MLSSGRKGRPPCPGAWGSQRRVQGAAEEASMPSTQDLLLWWTLVVGLVSVSLL